MWLKVKNEVPIKGKDGGALFDCGYRGDTEFRPEFEAFLCDSHHRWAIRKSWKEGNRTLG